MASEWFIAKTPKKKYAKLNGEEDDPHEKGHELQDVTEDKLKRSEVKLKDENAKGKCSQ